ncbi:hypothetical protein FBR05_08980 [Deltaproteobacteria bacterium PRO3]|nr:hypothetical protein [Deltaproteobacteria bacterium PRO3]
MENSAALPATPAAPAAPGGPGGPIGPCGPGGPGGPGSPRRKSKKPPDPFGRLLEDFSGGFCGLGLGLACCACKVPAQSVKTRMKLALRNEKLIISPLNNYTDPPQRVKLISGNSRPGLSRSASAPSSGSDNGKSASHRLAKRRKNPWPPWAPAPGPCPGPC